MAKEKLTQAQQVQELERIMKKVLRKSFKDSTLDYTVQIASTSVEPGKVKYGFMINGLKKEVAPIAMSYDSFDACKLALSALLDGINPHELEKTFHNGRINVYKNAIKSHEERLEEMEKNPEADNIDDAIPMEEVAVSAEESDEK